MTKLLPGISQRTDFYLELNAYEGGLGSLDDMAWDLNGRLLMVYGHQSIWNWDMVIGHAYHELTWDDESGKASQSILDNPREQPHASIDIQASNGLYRAACSKNLIELLNTSTGRLKHISLDAETELRQPAFSCDGNLLLALVRDNVWAWRCDTGELVTKFGDYADLLSVNQKRPVVAVATGWDSHVLIWDLDIPKLLAAHDLLVSLRNLTDAQILKKGVDCWNFWRRYGSNRKPNFSRENLSQLNLSGADLSSASLFAAKLRRSSLRGANLSNVDLSYSDARGSDFSGSDLEGAKLIETFLSGADLARASLLNATLLKAELTGVEFTEADLTNATVGWTVFGNNDLSTVKGLETVRHEGPSDIGLNTLYSSHGKIPTVFLRGCGLPESFIKSLPALLDASDVAQFYSCFISYSHVDEEFARYLHARLTDAHIRIWFAPEDVKGGQKLYDQIHDAILKHDRLLIVLSEHSLRSQWVMTELRKAMQTEIRENRRKLFPIRLVDFDTLQKWECFDADSGNDLAVKVREYFIPDFSGWKTSVGFEAAFDRLLKDLRTEYVLSD